MTGPEVWCICEDTSVRDVLAWFGLVALLWPVVWWAGPRRKRKGTDG